MKIRTYRNIIRPKLKEKRLLQSVCLKNIVKFQNINTIGIIITKIIFQQQLVFVTENSRKLLTNFYFYVKTISKIHLDFCNKDSQCIVF